MVARCGPCAPGCWSCGAGDTGRRVGAAGGTLPEALARLEAAMVARALAASGGNRTEAARRLGIHRQLLHTKLAARNPLS